MVMDILVWCACFVDTVVFCAHRLAKIKEWIDARDPAATIIPFSGALELKVNILGFRLTLVVLT